MKKILVVCMVMFSGMLMITGVATAFNLTHLQKLKTTNQCPNCDLSMASLNGASLSGANLKGASLIGTSLSGANLTRTSLIGASLSGALWIDGGKCKEMSYGACAK